jgi:hypothetical protein
MSGWWCRLWQVAVQLVFVDSTRQATYSWGSGGNGRGVHLLSRAPSQTPTRDTQSILCCYQHSLLHARLLRSHTFTNGQRAQSRRNASEYMRNIPGGTLRSALSEVNWTNMRLRGLQDAMDGNVVAR